MRVRIRKWVCICGLLAAVAGYLLLFTLSVALLAMSVVLPLLLFGSVFSVGWQFAFG